MGRPRTRAPKRPGRHGGASPTTALVPAAATVVPALGERFSDRELDLNAGAINTFVKAVGGRDAFIATLSVADAAPEAEQIVNLLLDPRYERVSLRRLCAIAGITVADLFQAYRKALIARAHIQAAHIVAKRLPPIVEDVMRRATPEQTRCPSCKGTGHRSRKNPRGETVLDTCLRCRGRGVLYTEVDIERQKLALELGHLTEKKAGLVVQQNQFAAVAGQGALASRSTGALEQLQQVVGERLFDPRRRRAAAPLAPEAPLAADVVGDPRNDAAPRQDPPVDPTAVPDEDDRDDADETPDDDAGTPAEEDPADAD